MNATPRSNPVIISLIVCTRNRASALARCLEQIALQQLATDRWELILVDNGSTDETPTVIKEFAERAAFKVQLVLQPTPGQGRARNAGIKAAIAPLLAFTDDDCYPAPDFLQEMVAVFADERVGYAGGRVRLYDRSDAPVTIREDEVSHCYAPFDVVDPGVIQGASMCIRRAVFDEVGLFDIRLGPGTPFICDDVELCGRAAAAGWSGGFFPGPVVFHHHGRKPGREANEQRRVYDYGRGAYFAKFIARPDTRRRYLSAWIRRLLALYRQGPGFSSRWREIVGAARFWLQGGVKPQ